MEDPMMDNADAPPEEASNRPFLIGVAVLGGILVLGIISFFVFALVVIPGQRAARERENDANIATNTAVAATAEALTQIASLPTDTPVPSATATEAATATPAPTETPVVAPSDTPVPTDTQAASETPSGSTGGGDTPTITTTPSITATSSRPTNTATGGTPGSGAGGGASATPTKLPSRTPSPVPPTATVVGTGSGGAVLTATPIGLPNTGFADDVGVQNLLIVGLALIAIVIIARRLRYSLR